MKKIFLYNSKVKNTYSNQLTYAYKIYKKKENNLEFIDINFIKPEYMNGYDIVISSNLPKKFEVYAKKQKIILFYLDEYKKKNDCDIIIDYRYKGHSNDFTGNKYKINKNISSNFDFFLLFNIIVVLEWDSAFWGYPVSLITSTRFTSNIIYRLDLFLKKNKIRLIQYLCNCHDRKSVYLAENNNFEFKDIRITFEKFLGSHSGKKVILGKTFRKAVKKDIKILKKISQSIYKDSRYYFDLNFSRKKIQVFYDEWIIKAINKSFDDECFLYCKDSIPVSYCTLRYNGNEEAIIGLFGVDRNFTGRGYGSKLINKVFNFLAMKGFKKILVVTQGRNIQAQRFYQKEGFLTNKTELWYHNWLY